MDVDSVVDDDDDDDDDRIKLGNEGKEAQYSHSVSTLFLVRIRFWDVDVSCRLRT